MKKHTEARFEDAIVHHLCEHGGYTFVDYLKG
jgi:type I restriction enzyme, R subunit